MDDPEIKKIKNDIDLVVIQTHPVQYHAPVYRALEQQFGISVTVIYGSDFSVAGYFDKEFGKTFAWDTDLLSGYTSYFLSRVSEGGRDSVEKVSSHGLGNKLRKIKPKAVLITGYTSRFHQEVIFQVLKQGCPIFFRAETTDHAIKRKPIKTWIRNCALSWFYKQCKGLLYIGKRSYEHFKRLQCPDKKLFFSPYCVDMTPFHPTESDRDQLRLVTRQQIGIPQSHKVFLFSGKLSQRKGPDLFLEVVHRFSSEIRDEITALFMGDGELKQQLEIMAKRLSVKAKFIGFQNQTALSGYYHAADLLVMPSRHSETWGLVVNEALHHGVPCVVSEAVGCVPDLVEPGATGELFETNCVKSFVQALMRAFSLVGRLEIRQRCRNKVSGYTVEKAAEGIAQAYRETVGIHAG